MVATGRERDQVGQHEGSRHRGADGQVGTSTLAALNSHKAPLLVLKALNILQGAHYITIAEGNKSHEVFVNSWFSRVSLT
jgi:lysozyme family protein